MLYLGHFHWCLLISRRKAAPMFCLSHFGDCRRTHVYRQGIIHPSFRTCTAMSQMYSKLLRVTISHSHRRGAPKGMNALGTYLDISLTVMHPLFSESFYSNHIMSDSLNHSVYCI